MGAAEEVQGTDVEAPADERTRALALAPDAVEVRRNAGLMGLVGALAAVVGIAYLGRALQTGAVLDWLLSLGMAGIGCFYVAALVDARSPLLVADAQGVRIRLGRTWRGVAWGSLERVEHVPAAGRLRDGRLVLVPRNPQRAVDGLPGRGRRQVRSSQRWYGAPLAVPLGLATRTNHAGADLTEALQVLAGGATLVVEPLELVEDAQDERAPRRRWRDPRPAIAETIDRVAASHTPSPLRETTAARRAEMTVPAPEPVPAPAADPDDTQPIRLVAGELRRPGSVSLVEDTQAWGDRPSDERARNDRVSPIAREGSPVEPLAFDDDEDEPVRDPVVGPELAAARTRLGLTVDGLAERTRIRPHVIEAIEADDFEACGGDFYARGHLRTLARVLGVDVGPLLADYEERYSQAPIDPRRVFEAELATAGSIRGTRGGPNWSVLVAAVMALVLAWSIARLVTDSPVELRSVPALNGSAGPGNGGQQAGPTVPVLLRAAGGGAHVEVRDGSGKVVFTGDIAYGQTKALEISPPVRVQSSDGSVEVVVDGSEQGALGATGRPATDTYVVR